ncbi:MAG: porin family protein [Bacteroidales bacterium]
MKKKLSILFLTVLTVMLSFPVIAQEHAITWSVVAGLSKSSIVGESESWKDPLGGQIGVYASLSNFSESMSLKLEANLSMQGAKWEENIDGYISKGRTNLLYLNMPLVVRYRHSKGYFAEVGLQPGFLLAAKDKYDGGSDNYMDFMKKFDFSVPVGIGYEFRKKYAVGIRVIPGLTNVNSDGSAKDRNFVAALRFAYTIE